MNHIGKNELTKLIIENRHYFYRIAFGYVKNEQDALDIVSESTYKALSHYKDLRDSKYFKTWMTRIIINTSLELIRKSSRQVFLEDHMLEHDESTSIELEVNYDLYVALDALDADDKSFIILKYFEEYTFNDISKLLNLPESTVKSKVYKCLKSMRTYMESGGEA